MEEDCGANACDRYACTCGYGDTEPESFGARGEKEIGDAHSRHEHGREKRYPIDRAGFYKVDGDGPESESRQGLVAPGEVSPEDVEID